MKKIIAPLLLALAVFGARGYVGTTTGATAAGTIFRQITSSFSSTGLPSSFRTALFGDPTRTFFPKTSFGVEATRPTSSGAPRWAACRCARTGLPQRR